MFQNLIRSYFCIKNSIQVMGNSNYQNTTALKIDYQQWKQIGYQDQTRMVVSTRGQGQGQQKIVVIDPKSNIEEEYKIYNYRKNQDRALVKVLGVQQFEKKSIGMCGSQQTMKVITEKIQYRWAKLPQLTLPECLYALNQSLKGYRECYEKIGSFDVTQNMVAINQNGQLKVWLNQNFAMNHPSFQKPLLRTSGQNKYGQLVGGNRDEQDMVKNIIDVIEERCEQGRYPPGLRNRLHMCNTFLTAQTQVQQFAQKHNIWVPDRIYPQFVVSSQSTINNKAHKNYIRPYSNNFQINPQIPNTIPIQSHSSIPFIPQPQIISVANQSQSNSPFRSMGHEMIKDNYYSPSVQAQTINPSFANNQIRNIHAISEYRDTSTTPNLNGIISGYRPFIPPISTARTQNRPMGIKFNYSSPRSAAANVQISQVKPVYQNY